MAKAHDCRAFTNLIKYAATKGCVIEHKKSGSYAVKTPNGQMYIAHAGERGYHPLRRFLKHQGIEE